MANTKETKLDDDLNDRVDDFLDKKFEELSQESCEILNKIFNELEKYTNYFENCYPVKTWDEESMRHYALQTLDADNYEYIEHDATREEMDNYMSLYGLLYDPSSTPMYDKLVNVSDLIDNFKFECEREIM